MTQELVLSDKDEVRFWMKVKSSKDGCWEWIGGCFTRGYGCFSSGRRTRQSHRVSWMIHNGAIPDGMFVCHSCDNPKCVRPSHLFLGTAMDNKRDSINKGRHAIGSAVTIAKLSEDDVHHICRMLMDETVRYNTVAIKYGVTSRTIILIATGKTWCSITKDYEIPLRRPYVGSANMLAKLTEDKVREIRKEYALGGVSHGQLAKKYGVSRPGITRVLQGKIWSHA